MKEVGLMLHDARIVRMQIVQKNYIWQDVTLTLDTSGAMADARRLRLLHCTELETDDLSGCWWLGEEIARHDGCVELRAALQDADGVEKHLYAVCQHITLE